MNNVHVADVQSMEIQSGARIYDTFENSMKRNSLKDKIEVTLNMCYHEKNLPRT
jgi:hypothetical protein